MRMNGARIGINMDLIEYLEELRYSNSALMNAFNDEFYKYLGANKMLDNCLEIVWKWLIKEGYVK